MELTAFYKLRVFAQADTHLILEFALLKLLVPALTDTTLLAPLAFLKQACHARMEGSGMDKIVLLLLKERAQPDTTLMDLSVLERLHRPALAAMFFKTLIVFQTSLLLARRDLLSMETSVSSKVSKYAPVDIAIMV